MIKFTLQHRLAGFLTVLLFVNILVFGGIASYAILQAENKTARERLKSATHNLQEILTNSTGNHLKRAVADAENDTLRRFVQGGLPGGGAEGILWRLADDSLIAGVQLFSPDLRVIAAVPAGSLLPVLKAAEFQLRTHVGNLRHWDNRLAYPIIVGIHTPTGAAGYLVKWRILNSNAASMRGLISLAGENARLFIASADGTMWSDLQGEVANPVPAMDLSRPGPQVFKTPDYYSSAVNLEGTSWKLLLQLSNDSLHQTSRLAFIWLAGSALLLLLAGIVSARFITQKLSKALAGFTGMAGKIAQGNFDVQGPVVKGDEIGTFSKAFHEMSQKVKASQDLLRSEAEKYRLLFQLNPMPMWIMASDDFSILDVNDAAVAHYGYSWEEFMSLTTVALRPEEDQEKFVQTSRSREDTGIIPSGVWRHRKKNGEIIQVDVIAANLTYRGRKARLILANDVTEKMKTETELLRIKVQQQKVLTGVSLQVQEREREQLGKELHDNINQILASVKLNLELGSADEAYREKAVTNSLQHVVRVIQEIRTLSKQLVPPALDESLPDAVSDLLSETKLLTGIKFGFIHNQLDDSLLEDGLKVNLYRIIQEQISNIIKHAAASEVALVLKHDAGHLLLEITDNGRGFNVKKNYQGIGLRNIESRVRYYDGTWQVTSATGGGCTLRVEIPVVTSQRKPAGTGKLDEWIN